VIKTVTVCDGCQAETRTEYEESPLDWGYVEVVHPQDERSNRALRKVNLCGTCMGNLPVALQPE
jgi:hypothetical protein